MAHVWDVSTGATGAANDESFARTALTREGVIECAVLDDAVASRWPALVDALFQARKPNTIWVAHNNDDATALASRRGAHHLVGDSLDALVNRIIVAFLDWKYAGIYAGGPKRWTAGQEQRDFETQWHNMAAHVADLANKTLLVPFAGDSPIVQYAHECGIRSVTAVEWAPVAIAKHRERFGGNGNGTPYFIIFFSFFLVLSGSCRAVPPSVHLVEAEWFAWAAAQPPATYDVVLDKVPLQSHSSSNLHTRSNRSVSSSLVVVVSNRTAGLFRLPHARPARRLRAQRGAFARTRRPCLSGGEGARGHGQRPALSRDARDRRARMECGRCGARAQLWRAAVRLLQRQIDANGVFASQRGRIVNDEDNVSLGCGIRFASIANDTKHVFIR